jgi:phosphorylcholine metabolism protein LicD/CDP-glycerol glycerophosphotransferase (TagB/SpsB family)
VNLDIAAKGLTALHNACKGFSKQEKIVLLSRQSSTESLDFSLLTRRLRERMPGVDIVLSLTDPETADLPSFIKSTITMSKEIAEARVCIVDGYLPAISVPDLGKKTRVIQLWHSLGAIKKFGYQCVGTPAGRTREEAEKLRMHCNYDWIVASGMGAVSAYSEAFGYPPDRIVPCGLPRMDYLRGGKGSAFEARGQEIKRLRPELQGECMRVLYAPTFRRGADANVRLNREVGTLAEAFSSQGVQLVVSCHPLDTAWDQSAVASYDNVAVIPDTRTCDLLGLVDAVVTDYSAIAFEAGLVGVPTYFYLPDIDEYRKTPGLNIDPLKEFPDCSFGDASQLVEHLLSSRAEQDNSFARYCQRYFQGSEANATDRICDLVEYCYKQTKGEVPQDSFEQVSLAAGSPTGRSWAFDVYRSLLPLLEGKVFAYGDTCVGAIHYHGYFEGMSELSFAALRKDFDQIRDPIAMLAEEAGWYVRGASDSDLPYLRITPRARALDDARSTFCIYPMDQIPHQNTLRFKMLAEARKADFRNPSQVKRLKRYEDVDTGIVSRLFGNGRASGVMGERTIQQRTVRTEALFPLRYVAFEDSQIQIPDDVSNWTSEPSDQREAITKTIQQDGLRSLSEIKRVSALTETQFFLVGGSMLGAVRHGGFIPWDDDIDVGMLRADYKKFVKKAPDCLAPDFFLQLPSTDPHIHFVYARLRHRGIDYITLYNENKDFDKSLWVDLFPFDATPHNRVLSKAQRKFARFSARAAMGFKRRKEYAQEDLNDGHPLLQADARYLKRYAALSKLFPVKLTSLVYHFTAEFFNPFLAGKDGTRYASFIPTYTTIEPGEGFPVRWIDFSGEKMPILNGAEKFLERQYGDYMKLPPQHERQTDHGFLRLEFSDGAVLECGSSSKLKDSPHAS